MQTRELAGRHPVELFGEGAAQIAAAQTGFNVRKGYAAIKGCEGRSEHGRGIALPHHTDRVALDDDPVQAGQTPRIQVRQ